MNDFPHDRELLNDVLGENTLPGFREALLDRTLRVARRRRRFRQVRNAGLGLATLALAAILVSRILPPVSSPAPSRKPYVLVRTQPLPETALVQTRTLAPSRVIASEPTQNVVSTTSAAANGVRELTDDELLSLAAPRVAVLVRQGPHSAELVFVEPAEREGSQQ